MPRLMLCLLLALNLGMTTGAQNSETAAAQNAFEIENFQRLKTALDGLSFQVGLVTWSCISTECDSALPGVELSGPGMTDAATVERQLIEAGFNPSTTHVGVIPAPTFPPVSQLPWPLKGEVISPEVVSASKPMPIRVRLTSQTFFPATVFSGDCALDAVVLDEAGQPATWLGQNFCQAVDSRLSVPAWGTGELASRIDLTRFNPRLPLAPGSYTLRVQVRRVAVSLGSFGDALYSLKPSDRAVTLPDVTFQIVP